MAAANDLTLIACRTTHGVWIQASTAGALIGSPQQIVTSSNIVVGGPSVALSFRHPSDSSDYNAYAMWVEASAGTGQHVMVRRINCTTAGCAAVGNPAMLDQATPAQPCSHPRIATGPSGNFVFAWSQNFGNIDSMFVSDEAYGLTTFDPPGDAASTYTNDPSSLTLGMGTLAGHDFALLNYLQNADSRARVYQSLGIDGCYFDGPCTPQNYFWDAPQEGDTISAASSASVERLKLQVDTTATMGLV